MCLGRNVEIDQRAKVYSFFKLFFTMKYSCKVKKKKEKKKGKLKKFFAVVQKALCWA